jgi:DNA modification methylase
LTHACEILQLGPHTLIWGDCGAALAWWKSNPQPVANKHYLPDLEFWIHGWNEGFHPQRGPDGLASVKRVFASAGGRNEFGHPTQKPLPLMAKVLTNLGGEAVCDPYMGTGSTGVAAIALGKTFIGIERERRWFDVAVARIKAAAEAAG